MLDQRNPSVVDVGTGKRDNPEIKILHYGDRKIIFAPDGILLITAGTMISLSDEEGVAIISDSDIRLQAANDISITAAGEINMIGAGGVKLKSELASIEMNEDIRIEGKEIHANQEG